VNLVHYPETKSLVESILSGDVATAARWAVYRAVREDVVQTWQVLQRNPALVLGGGEP
jgi:hypothetical protein